MALYDRDLKSKKPNQVKFTQLSFVQPSITIFDSFKHISHYQFRRELPLLFHTRLRDIYRLLPQYNPNV